MRQALLVFAISGLMSSAFAQGSGRHDYFVMQLTTARDARLRAQSALMLGAMQETEAMQPLCGALGDDSGLVKSAAAKALAQLGETSALSCLKSHERDGDAEVSSAVRDAMTRLG